MMLLVGGLILPVVGWLIGVVMLWVSNAWNVRDKVIGTIFVPGGLGVLIFLFFAVGTSSAARLFGHRGLGLGNAQVTTCAESGTSSGEIIGFALLVALAHCANRDDCVPRLSNAAKHPYGRHRLSRCYTSEQRSWPSHSSSWNR